MSQSHSDTMRRLSLFTLGAFLVIVVGTNSVAAAGGPLTWLTFWHLPAAGGELAGIGPVSLLPILSVAAWALYRWLAPSSLRQPWQWGSWRITLPALSLWLWAMGRGAWQCLDGPCPRGTIVRLILLAAVFFWAYLLIVNEKPDLLWVIVAIVFLQSAVAIAQFVIQHDIGWRSLGELPLDPAASGVIVVLNGSERWLRGYGLTNQPNVLARLLVLCLLMLPIVARGSSGARRALAVTGFAVGVGGLISTLSRWGWACLMLGLAINAIPFVATAVRTRTISHHPRRLTLIGGTVLLAALSFLSQFGGAVYGRFFDLNNPMEAGSRSVRLRDMGAGLEIWRGALLTGVGPANYEAAAAAILPAAALVPTVPIVPSVPLYIAAEVGLVGLLLWLVLGIWPLWRRSALTTYAPNTALWVIVFVLGIFYVNPNPLYELRSTLLVAMAAGLLAQSWAQTQSVFTETALQSAASDAGIGRS